MQAKANAKVMFIILVTDQALDLSCPETWLSQ